MKDDERSEIIGEGEEDEEEERAKCRKWEEDDRYKRGDYSPFIAMIVFYLVIIFLVISFSDGFSVPWIPLLTALIVFLMCLFRLIEVAWFVVIFIISLFLIYILVAIPTSYIYLLVGVTVLILAVYGGMMRRFFWMAPLAAFIMILIFIFFINKL